MGEAGARIAARDKASEAFQAMASVVRYIHGCDLERSLVHVVQAARAGEGVR